MSKIEKPFYLWHKCLCSEPIFQPFASLPWLSGSWKLLPEWHSTASPSFGASSSNLACNSSSLNLSTCQHVKNIGIASFLNVNPAFINLDSCSCSDFLMHFSFDSTRKSIPVANASRIRVNRSAPWVCKIIRWSTNTCYYGAS